MARTAIFADWADARVVLADALEVWLFQLPLLRAPAHQWGGVLIHLRRPTLGQALAEAQAPEAVADGTRLSYRDPLRSPCACTARSFPDFRPCRVLEFEYQLGTKPLLERVCARCDIAIRKT